MKVQSTLEGQGEVNRSRMALLIAGPTASGKSALALRLAQSLGGVVINCDSMQVYRDLSIITARPSRDEEVAAPHALYGHVDGAVNYSAGAFARDAGPLLAKLADEGRMPILAGGTGLYFKALTEGLSQMPAVPDDVRETVRSKAEGRETLALHAELAALDAATAAALRPADRQRVLRALEILTATGLPPSHFHAMREAAPLAGWHLASVFLAPDRDWLKQRIDARFDVMMEGGALEEVSQLAARRLDPALPVMRAHGVPGLIAHLAGEVSLAEAVMRGKADTRAYVKRQFTWFRNQMPGFVWAQPLEAEAALRAQMEPDG
ncbi:MAG: tRNA (adenosine(37)-N6)-dimethylallyltransferase MiaA [Bosea sp. (in: a-proteobacteria)]